MKYQRSLGRAPHVLEVSFWSSDGLKASAYSQCGRAQPRGQFRLSGYCNGGLLAWEIAHRLHHAGREIESCHPYQHFLTECATSIARPQSIAVCGLTPLVRPSTSRYRVRRSLMSALWKLGRSRPNGFKRVAQVVASRFRGKHFMTVSDTRNASHMRAMAN